MVLFYFSFLPERQPCQVYVQPKNEIHLQRTMMIKVITNRISWREWSRGYSPLQGTEGLFPHHCNPLNIEDAAQHQKGYCLLPLTIFPSVPFTDLEVFITSAAAKQVFFSWKTKTKTKTSHFKWTYLYMSIFSLPV